MTVLVAIVRIRPAVVIEVFSCTVPSILKSTLPRILGDVAAPSLGFVAYPFAFPRPAIVIAHKVTHRSLITTAKALTIGFAKVERKIGVPVLVPIVYIRTTMVVEVLSRTFDAILKAPALDLLPLTRRRIPRIPILDVSAALTVWYPGCPYCASASGPQEKSKNRHYKPIKNHYLIFLRFEKSVWILFAG